MKPFFFSFLLFTGFTGFAQKNEISFGASGVIYQGDLTPAYQGSLKNIRPGFTLSYSISASDKIAVRLNLGISQLKCSDSDYEFPFFRKQRNFSFSSALTDFSVLFTVKTGSLYNKVQAYFTGGAGVASVNTKADASAMTSWFITAEPDIEKRVEQDLSKNLQQLLFILPAGVGIKYNLSDRLNLSLETLTRSTFSDYLDGFSVSAMPSKNDHYHFTSLLVGFYLTDRHTKTILRSVRCPY